MNLNYPILSMKHSPGTSSSSLTILQTYERCEPFSMARRKKARQEKLKLFERKKFLECQAKLILSDVCAFLWKRMVKGCLIRGLNCVT